MTTHDRFWSKVARGGQDECWLWRGAVSSNGYGNFASVATRRESVFAPAHRFAYEQLVGPIPDGLVIDHLCRNRLCVNPAHLEPVTTRENVIRGFGPSAVNLQKSVCAKGHDDWQVRPNKGRRCLSCQREDNRSDARRIWRDRSRALLWGPDTTTCSRCGLTYRGVRAHNRWHHPRPTNAAPFVAASLREALS